MLLGHDARPVAAFRGRAVMKLPRREFLRWAASAAALPAIAVSAQAQGYPTRPVRLILGYPAGGSTDLVARIMGAWLAERLARALCTQDKPSARTQSGGAGGGRFAA